jgi:molecular chaperone DnaK
VIIGIDLGTTNSAVARVLNTGKPEIIENLDGHRTTPSVVQLSPMLDLFVGQNAKDNYPAFPERTILEIKRKMGSSERVALGDDTYLPEEISALILSELKKAVELKYGEEVTEAVITVPAYFKDPEKRATIKAGEIAGLKVERIIDEPTAAAICFGYTSQNREGTFLIYDLGGGTFDVSIVEIKGNKIKVLAKQGDRNLGGADFDDMIVQWIVTEANRMNDMDVLNYGPTDQIEIRKARLKLEAERVKKLLSSRFSTETKLDRFAVIDEKVINLRIELTRTDFEKMIREKVESTLHHIDLALKSSRLKMEDINDVLMVGGSTRIPLVQEMVEKKFGKAPRRDVHPDEVVAMGAAILAAIKHQYDCINNFEVEDICTHSLGTDVRGLVAGRYENDVFDVLIPKNQVKPAEVTKTYGTVNDNQSKISIGIYQGEKKLCRDNLRIREFTVDGIPKGPAGEESIEITFKYNENEILEVKVKIVSTGKEVVETIEFPGEPSIIEDGKRGDGDGDTDDEEKIVSIIELNKVVESVKKTIHHAERQLSNFRPSDRAKVENVIQKLKDAMESRDITAMQKYDTDLVDLIGDLM